MIDIDKLERLAESATPGEWKFIAAANPAVVLELIARLRAAEGIVRGLAENEPTDRSGDCLMCPASWPSDVSDHHESCPWRRATEYVK